MKNSKFLIVVFLCLILFGNNLLGQTKLFRTALYTLPPGETILKNEYFAAQHLDKNKFSCITVNYEKKTISFIFNGIRIITIDATTAMIGGMSATRPLSDYRPTLLIDMIFEISYLNSLETNGYVFKYKQNEEWIVNYHGSKNGPYEEVTLDNDENNEIDYSYKLAGKEFIYFEGKNQFKKRETKNKLETSNSDESTTNYLFSVESEFGSNDFYLEKNGARYIDRSFPSINDLSESSDHQYAFWYIEPYKYKTAEDALEGFDKKEHWVVINFNNKEFKIPVFETTGSQQIFNFHFNRSDKLEYKFFNYKTGRLQVNIGETVTYERFNLSQTDWIQRNSSNSYEFCEFSSPSDEIELYPNSNDFLYSNYKYEYVVINGNRYGKAPALGAWYDNEKKKFVWYTYEGQEVVLYEYFL